MAESCAWVRLPVRGRESLFTDVGIPLCCCDVGVTKKFLNRPQVCSAVKQMGCVRMPQGMRVRGRSASAVKDAANIARSKSAPALIRE